MKADERVSDERIEQLLGFAREAQADASFAALRELQARRAAEQAALPAVEEMASDIQRLVAKIVSEYLPGDVLLGDEYRGEINEVIAPLYAKLAALEQQLSRNQQFVADQGRAIAERDAVLGEAK